MPSRQEAAVRAEARRRRQELDRERDAADARVEERTAGVLMAIAARDLAQEQLEARNGELGAALRGLLAEDVPVERAAAFTRLSEAEVRRLTRPVGVGPPQPSAGRPTCSGSPSPRLGSSSPSITPPAQPRPSHRGARHPVRGPRPLPGRPRPDGTAAAHPPPGVAGDAPDLADPRPRPARARRSGRPAGGAGAGHGDCRCTRRPEPRADDPGRAHQDRRPATRRTVLWVGPECRHGELGHQAERSGAVHMVVVAVAVGPGADGQLGCGESPRAARRSAPARPPPGARAAPRGTAPPRRLRPRQQPLGRPARSSSPGRRREAARSQVTDSLAIDRDPRTGLTEWAPR